VIDSQAALIEYLARAAKGDREAFRLLYERTAPKLLASARRILGGGSVAEDAMQEAYVRIWRHAGDFDPAIASPVAWMTTIARHAAIDMARSGPEKVSSASKTFDTELAERLAAPAAGGDPLATSRLSACLGKLEADRRGMLVLAYCYGWSREELAGRFAKPVATVKTNLRRSLAVLKECLGGNER
jgi:RNA polymerase sigma-70 factor (ECF subfamily)